MMDGVKNYRRIIFLRFFVDNELIINLIYAMILL